MRNSLLFVLSAAVFAQNSGTITGTVSDNDGVALGKAAIEATNVATKAVYKAESSAAGAYTLKGLPAGTYDLQAVVAGMVPFEHRNLVVTVAQTTRLNVQLGDLSLNTAGEDREFFADLTRRHQTPAGPTPRMANGKPDLSGVWLASLPTEPQQPELLATTQAIVKERIGNNMKDVPSSRCQPNGVTLFGIFTPFRIVHTPAYLVMITEHDLPGFRQLFLDGRSHPKNLEPTWMGHSVGHWEGDTLVVETVGFNGNAWLDLEGRPFTEKTRIIERYGRPELGHLEIEFTIDDASAYLKPWTIKRISDLASKEEEVGEYICTENNRDVPHLVGK